jgi:hypothetical protein
VLTCSMTLLENTTSNALSAKGNSHASPVA